MLAIAKLVLLALVAVLVFALSTEGRELLQYYNEYDDCYNGKHLSFGLRSFQTLCEQQRPRRVEEVSCWPHNFFPHRCVLM